MKLVERIRDSLLFSILSASFTIPFAPVVNFRYRRILSSSTIDVDDGIGVGIDLGTTFSAVAHVRPDDGLPEIIPIPENGRTMASVVSLYPTLKVGKSAIIRNANDSEFNNNNATYYNVKRIVGTGGKLDRELLRVVPFVKPNKDGKTYKKNSLTNRLYDAEHFPTMLQNRFVEERKNDNDDQSDNTNIDEHTNSALISPEAISAHVVRKLIEAAESHTGQTVTRAVVGVPAHFDDAQREATLRAAELAGVPQVKLLREPEAAALAYGVGIQQEQKATITDDDDDLDELVLVFDLGGGTFDVSMLMVGGGITEVICTSGNAQLGGSDFDQRVARHLSEQVASSSTKKQHQHLFSVTDTQSALVRSAEAVRIHLSNNKRALLALPKNREGWNKLESADQILQLAEADKLAFHEGKSVSNETHVFVEYTRRQMEVHCQAELQDLMRPVREVAIMAGALLPGDASPNSVEIALELEEDIAAANNMQFQDFYEDDDDEENANNEELKAQLLEQAEQMDTKSAKRAQQKARKKARTAAKKERKYRQERRKLDKQQAASAQSAGSTKVRGEGITGRPISRIVLVGGATRMPCVGRLLEVMTGTRPQRTVNPDEAVALGCAVHVGILDGKEGDSPSTTVLNPMQAAILRALAEQKQGLAAESDEEFFGADDGMTEFDSVEFF